MIRLRPPAPAPSSTRGGAGFGTRAGISARAGVSAIVTVLAAALFVSACATMGAPREIDMRTVAVRVAPGATPEAVSEALRAAGARVAFVTADEGAQWFERLATASELTLSGPATMGDLRLAFLAPEPVGDTTVRLPYEGGTLTVQDALYEIRDERYLDLIGFRIGDPAGVRPAIGALLQYMATDVNNAAAVALAVAVPNSQVADSVARMLAPAYYDALRCAGQENPAPSGEHIRLFYGPEARMFCVGASMSEAAVGDWVEAELIMGRR